MTLNEGVYNITNIARNGQGDSDDTKLSPKQVEFWINYHRSHVAHLMTQQGNNIDAQLIQDMGIVPLTDVDKADSSCPAVEWGCVIKKITIPKLVDFPGTRALTFVGLIDKQTPIVLDYADTHIFERATQFGKLMNRAYLIGNTLYVSAREGYETMKYINIRGVFEDPTEVFTYAYPGCTPRCFDRATDEYPISQKMYDEVLRRIMGRELSMTLQTVTDEQNNAREENAKRP